MHQLFMYMTDELLYGLLGFLVYFTFNISALRLWHFRCLPAAIREKRGRVLPSILIAKILIAKTAVVTQTESLPIRQLG